MEESESAPKSMSIRVLIIIVALIFISASAHGISGKTLAYTSCCSNGEGTSTPLFWSFHVRSYMSKSSKNQTLLENPVHSPETLGRFNALPFTFVADVLSEVLYLRRFHTMF